MWKFHVWLEPRRLTPWLLALSCHQWPWHWTCRINGSLIFTWKYFNHLDHPECPQPFMWGIMTCPAAPPGDGCQGCEMIVWMVVLIISVSRNNRTRKYIVMSPCTQLASFLYNPTKTVCIICLQLTVDDQKCEPNNIAYICNRTNKTWYISYFAGGWGWGGDGGELWGLRLVWGAGVLCNAFECVSN